MISAQNTVLKIIAGKTDEPMFAEIISKNEIASAQWQINDRNGAKIADGNCEINGNKQSWDCNSRQNLLQLAYL